MAGSDDLSLSQSYFPLTITTTAGTAIASPKKVTVAIPPCVLTDVDIQIPHGHAGQTGIRVVYSGQVIVPFGGADADTWIIGDDAEPNFQVSFPISTGLVIQTYNTGVFDHSHYVTLKVDYNAMTEQSVAPLLTIVPSA